MRNSTYHGPNQRPTPPQRHRCAKCAANAPFTVAQGVHLCGVHADAWYAAKDAK